uniref:Uncharacterized protein n=1 Tax=Aegilops tauschii subsp. strangulata TaxID=200361 RepID=A0A453HEE9_AEGTS
FPSSRFGRAASRVRRNAPVKSLLKCLRLRSANSSIHGPAYCKNVVFTRNYSAVKKCSLSSSLMSAAFVV